MNTISRILYAAGCSVLGLAQAAMPQERLYAIAPTNDDLLVLSTQTGQVLESHVITGPGSDTAYLNGLTSDGTRLLSHDNVLLPAPPDDRIISLHAADASRLSLGATGFDWINDSSIDIEYDASTGTVYTIGLNDLYKVDLSTGALTHVAPITGLTQVWQCICSIAIDASGNAIGTGAFGTSGVEVYDIDLSTGVAQFRGEIATGTNRGSFVDLAVSATGEYWGSFVASGGVSGLTRIDLSTLTCTFVSNSSYRGIAFGPDCLETTYCAPKVNSQGCTPTISMQGLASATGTSGFRVECSNVLNQSFGTLFYSLTGQGSTPFAGGTLCLNAPMSRYGGLVSSGGSARPANDCTGTWSVDFNSLMTNQGLGLPPGTIVDVQWMGRDRGFARPNAISLSDGAEFWLCP